MNAKRWDDLKLGVAMGLLTVALFAQSACGVTRADQGSYVPPPEMYEEVCYQGTVIAGQDFVVWACNEGEWERMHLTSVVNERIDKVIMNLVAIGGLGMVLTLFLGLSTPRRPR